MAMLKVEEKIEVAMEQNYVKEAELKALKADMKAIPKEKVTADKQKILDAIKTSG